MRTRLPDSSIVRYQTQSKTVLPSQSISINYSVSTLFHRPVEISADEVGPARREKINMRLQTILDTHTAPRGVKVADVEVKQVDMPESMLRAMAKQPEAEREKRSKIIHAEDEFSAAQRLVDAAQLLPTEPVKRAASLLADPE